MTHTTTVTYATDITRTLADVRLALLADRMIYQAQAKRDAARAAGVSPETYYRLSYTEWASLRDGTARQAVR